MKLHDVKRPYSMTSRAKKVSENEGKIMEALIQLWQEYSLNEITLEKIAAKSGITVRTILRKYGTKEGLIEACIENDAAGRRKSRDSALPGDYGNALKILIDDYEKLGDASIRTLALEDELTIAKKILDKGRANHREWCIRIFRPDLPEIDSPDYEIRLLTFITATEFYLWKLLRRDLKKSYSETFAVFQFLIEGLVNRKIT